ncbi:MAG: ABC transporter permease [Candidatus Competibacteraceae bacterium]|nr:ABC transporter permease [Candidatus Competibacteraceae bacterium]
MSSRLEQRADAQPAASSRRTIWARLALSPGYQAISATLLKTERRRFWLLASFPLIWVLVANLGPILQMFKISFLDAYPPSIGQTPQWTLANWLSFFEESIFIIPYTRTIVFSAVLTLITLILTYPVAYYLAKHVRRQRQLLFLLLLLVPFWVGEIVRTYAIMILLGNRGFINLTLSWLGLIERPIPFMYTNFSLGLGVIYLTSLYMLLPLYSALEKIPNSYREAAADLGAGPWTRFWRVILPLSKDGIASGCTLVFLISTGFYATPVLLGGPSSTVFAETIAGFFHVAGDKWPTGAAFASIMLISTLTLTALFLKLMGRKGEGILK